MINKIDINLVFLCELKNNVNGPNTPRNNVYNTALFFTLNLYIIFYEEYITFFTFIINAYTLIICIFLVNQYQAIFAHGKGIP